MARKRPVEPVSVAVSASDVPLQMLAGPCVEVWCDEGEETLLAFRRHADARRAWLRGHGLAGTPTVELPEGLRRTGAPWSFDYLARTDPECLAQVLADRGLPRDSRPNPRPVS